MSPKDRWSRRPWIAAIILVVFAGFTVLISGQQGGQLTNPTHGLKVPILSHGNQESPEDIQGLPDDWTYHHLVFSNPGTEEEASRNGTHERWLKVVNDPRYIMQQLRRRAPAQGPYAEYVDRMNEAARDTADSASLELPADQLEDAFRPLKGERQVGRDAVRKDWSTSLGSGVAASLTGLVGTLNSSSITGSSTLTVDGVAFDASAPSAAAGSVQINCTTATCGNYTLTIGAITYAIQGSLSGTSPANQVLDGGSGTGHTNTAKNLRAAMLNDSSQCGSTSGGTCFRNLAGVNTTVTPGTGANPLTLAASTAGTGGNSTALSDTGCTPNGPSGSYCKNNDLTEISLDTTSTTSTVISTTFGATGTAGSDGTTSGTASPPTFAYWSVNNYVASSQVATNIATAVNANATVSAVLTATANSPASGNVLLTSKTPGSAGNSYAVSESGFSAFTPTSGSLSGGTVATVQPNTYPAKYGVSLTGASCADFAVYPTGQAGAAGAANIIAYDNLYATGTGAACSGGPSVYWAYNTGGTVTTSPILSSWDNGAQVAFIQVSGTTASLVLLKWSASGGSITSPTTLTSQSASSYRSCTAPCMYSVALSGSPNDTLSAPFYDYSNDLLYVGDDSGNLHQFSGAFEGSPAENTTSPWPVHLGSNKLSSPVYDTATAGSFQGGYVFVGDMGGVFYSVGTGYGGTTNGQIHGNTGSLGDAIADAPVVDASEGEAFVFVTTNGSYSETGDNAVWQFASSFTTLGTPGVVPVGTGGTGYYLYAGNFDNVYYQSGNPAYGHLYVVGNTGTAGGATLYQVDIAYSSMTGTVNAVATGLNSSEHPWPSPLTEFCNNGTSACAITSQRSVTGKVSKTSPEITILNGSGTFTSADVGAAVSGTDIPFGATITSVLGSTTANLSAAPTTAVSSETLSILGGQTTSGADYVFFSVNSPASGLCKNSSGIAESGAGWGCIFSYNVNVPTSVTQSGTGLAVTDPGTNGCWATGGLVIDNSATATGASQIYFVNLNGAAAGGPTGTTQTSGNCTGGAAPTINAVQAAQSSP